MQVETAAVLDSVKFCWQWTSRDGQGAGGQGDVKVRGVFKRGSGGLSSPGVSSAEGVGADEEGSQSSAAGRCP